MVSGRQTLASIDQAVTEARGRMAEFEARIEAANRQTVEQRQAQASDYKALARIRLGQVVDRTLTRELDQAEQQVLALLSQRQDALTALETRIQSVDKSLAELEAERARQANAVDAAAREVDAAEARTQARLDADPAYKTRLESAREAERKAMHAGEKATRSENEREQKGASYRADPLFMYLWKRNYGQPEYRSRGLFRWLDGKVAHLIGYADARANYARLIEIPDRLREHANALEAAADAEFSDVKSLDEAARAQDGIPEIEERLASEQAALDAIDARITQMDAERQDLITTKAEYSTGDDEHTKQAVEYLAMELQREDLMELRREALSTPLPDDDVIVARMLQREDEDRQLEASMQGLRETIRAQQKRLQELEALRADFKRSGYDRAGSIFGDNALVAMMLGQFLNGALDRQNLWRILQEQQRYRPQQSNPGFGSGGFGRGSVWGGGVGDLRDLGSIIKGGSHPRPRGGGFGRGGLGGGGGGFRTGGGF